MKIPAKVIKSSFNYPVVLFDGHCILCHRSVIFLLRKDRNKRLRFLSLQDSVSNQDIFESIILLENGKVYNLSTAAIKSVMALGGLWRFVGVLRVIPSVLRDWVYRKVSNNRNHWFGRTDSCFVPDESQKVQFLTL